MNQFKYSLKIYLFQVLHPDIGVGLGGVTVAVRPPPLLAAEQRGPLLLPATEQERDGRSAARFLHGIGSIFRNAHLSFGYGNSKVLYININSNK